MASSTSKCGGCLNKANSFCYVFGGFTTVAQRRTIISRLRTANFHYFDCKIGDNDKSWSPHICCKTCYNWQNAWFNGKKAAFSFAVPMVWREPWNHADDCYFCLTNNTGFNASSRKKIKYPNLWSAMRPVPHSDDLPVPTPPVNKDLLSSSDEEMPSREDSAESISLEDCSLSLEVFFIYPVLPVISCCNSWNMHIYSLFILKWDYLKAKRLEVIEQNYL